MIIEVANNPVGQSYSLTRAWSWEDIPSHEELTLWIPWQSRSLFAVTLNDLGSPGMMIVSLNTVGLLASSQANSTTENEMSRNPVDRQIVVTQTLQPIISGL